MVGRWASAGGQAGADVTVAVAMAWPSIPMSAFAEELPGLDVVSQFTGIVSSGDARAGLGRIIPEMQDSDATVMEVTAPAGE